MLNSPIPHPAKPASESDRPDLAEVERLVLLFNQHRLAEARQLASVMTQRWPQFALAWKVLGAVWRSAGELNSALDCLHTTVRLTPTDPEAHTNLGNVLKDLGRLDDAAACHRQALALRPGFVPAHNNLGNVQRELGLLADAEASYRTALKLDPRHVLALSNLGLTLKDLRRLAESRQLLLQALAIAPAYAEAWAHLGVTLNELGHFGDAEAALRKSIELQPDNAYAHVHLGITLRHTGRTDLARQSLEQAVSLAPDLAEAHNSLGAVLAELGMTEQALASYRRAIALDGNHAGASTNLATALASRGQFDTALALFEQVLQRKPNLREAHDNYLFALNYHPDMPAADIFNAYRRFDRQLGQPLLQSRPAPARRIATSRRLRIGYVSPDFRRHSCRHFLEPLLAHHDKARFEVFAYAELAQEDSLTTNFKRYMDHWRPTWGLSDEALARQIADDGIDILVDLAGHTAGNRLAVFARKPAPVAVSWLGYGYTTGLRAIDYFLTDGQLVPSGSEALFSEVPWRLGGTSLAYRPDATMPAVNPLPAARHGHVTFGSFTRAIRINHHVVRVWSAILNSVPGSRLVIDSGDFRGPDMQQHLAARFAEHGIQPERLQIGHHSPPWGLMHTVDIGLDCFAHNSGTTLFESLYMGIPFVTLAARASVGRMGSTILHGLGRTQWIAHTEEEYIRLASDMATDTGALASTRAGLRALMQASPLMDEAGFAHRVENAYRDMWHPRQP